MLLGIIKIPSILKQFPRDGFILVQTLVLLMFVSSFFVELGVHQAYQRKQNQTQQLAQDMSDVHYFIVSQLRTNPEDSFLNFGYYTIEFIVLNESDYLVNVSGPASFSVNASLDIEKMTLKSYNINDY